MSVHLGEAEISHRGGLEALQDLFPADLAVTKALEQCTGFVDRHGKKMSPNLPTVTREMVEQVSRGILMMVVVMPEQPVAILEKIRDHDDIDHQNDKDHQGKIMGQFVKLDGNEKRRFSNGQPSGPAH